MGGLEGADSWCTQLAFNAGLMGQFKAWLSTAEAGPATRFNAFPGPYKLVTGELVANDWGDLIDGSLAHPIDRTESGEMIFDDFVCEGQEVWTNTKSDGSPTGANDCEEWKSEVGNSNIGRFSATDAVWTNYFGCDPVSCQTPLPLYCVQQ